MRSDCPEKRKKNRKEEQEEETTSIINCHTLYSIFTLKQERKVALKASQVDPQLTRVIVSCHLLRLTL